MQCVKNELANDFKLSPEDISTCLVIAGVNNLDSKATAGAVLNLDGNLEKLVDLILDTTFNSFMALDDPKAIPQQKEQALKTIKILFTVSLAFKKGMLAYMKEEEFNNKYSHKIKKEFEDLAVEFINSLKNRNE
jgi:hypothetical protein